MQNKYLMSPERKCEVVAQYTPQIHFYSLLKLLLLGYEPKRADFEYVALNANELLLPEKRAELQELKLCINNTVQNTFAFMNYTDGEHGGIKITT